MINRLWFDYNSWLDCVAIAELLCLLNYSTDATRETPSLLSVEDYCNYSLHAFYGLIATLKEYDFVHASHVLTLLVKVQYDPYLHP